MHLLCLLELILDHEAPYFYFIHVYGSYVQTKDWTPAHQATSSFKVQILSSHLFTLNSSDNSLLLDLSFKLFVNKQEPLEFFKNMNKEIASSA